MNDIRMYVIRTANSDGSNENTVTATQVISAVEYTNRIYKKAGIRFVFDPETDFPPVLRNTLLNQDMLQISNPGSATKEDFDESWYKSRDEKERIASQYPGKLVIFYGSGMEYSYDHKTGKWKGSDWGGYADNWSNDLNSFVRMVGDGGGDQYKNKFPHEIGHYLHLAHTFRNSYETDEKKTPAERKKAAMDFVILKIKWWVDDQGNPKEKGTDVFDGDGLTDTLPNPGEDFFQDCGIDPCKGDSIKIDVDLKDGKKKYTLKPDINIMSYWGPCMANGEITMPNHISLEQVAIIRSALENGNRNHLIAPMVLYNAICEPFNPGQTGAIGWAQNDFAKRFDDEIAKGRHVVHMQAYVAANGQTAWDGVWESGDKKQTRAIAWAQNDFVKRFDDEIAKGRHVVHMQAYVAANGQTAWDGVWESGDRKQTRAIAWAQNDFIKRFDNEIAKGRHVVHMQAYVAANGQTAWDGVWESGDRKQTRAIAWAQNDFIKRFDNEIAKGRHVVHMQAYVAANGQTAWDGVWEPGNSGQTRALGLSIGDFTVRLDNQLANNKKIVHMQAYLRK